MLQKTFEEKNNPFFSDTIEQFEGRESKIKEWRTKLNSINAKIKRFGKNITEIGNRFKLADMGEVHTSVYKLQSQDVHNDLQRIEDRHFQTMEDVLSISMDTNWTINDLISHIITTVSIIKISIEKITEKFSLKTSDKIIKKIESNEKVIDTYFKNKYR